MYKSLDVISIMNILVLGFEKRHAINTCLIEPGQVFIAVSVETSIDDDADSKTWILFP
jgi:hypothetical protein